MKGKQYRVYSEGVQRGILLHREIDRYTDGHPVFLRSKHRLVPRHGHYAGVVVDMFYDHLLAVSWTDYSRKPLSEFVNHIYATLEENVALLPAPAQQVFEYMRAHDWLTNYAYPEGIAQALSGMQRRARFPNRMGEAGVDLQKDQASYAQEFARFFPQIQQHVHPLLKA